MAKASAVSIYVAILEQRLAANLPSKVTSAALHAGLPESSVPLVFEAITNGTVAAMDAVPGITPAIEGAVANAVKSAYSASFGTVYLVSIAFGAAAVIASLFTSNIDQFMTNYVSRRIRGTVATEMPVGKQEHADEEV